MEQKLPGIEVCLSPDLLYQHELQNKTVVVVDVLRATSTMCSALFHGVHNIIPVAGIDECLSYKGKENHILAAERDAKTPEGLFGLVPESTKKFFVEVNGYLFTSESRQVLLSIVGFYFGSAAASNKS